MVAMNDAAGRGNVRCRKKERKNTNVREFEAMFNIANALRDGKREVVRVIAGTLYGARQCSNPEDERLTQKSLVFIWCRPPSAWSNDLETGHVHEGTRAARGGKQFPDDERDGFGRVHSFCPAC
jgi:hypothetical protein